MRHPVCSWGSVIEALARLEFKDGLRSPPWRLLVPLWQPHLAQDQFCTAQEGACWSWKRCGCHKDPCQTKFQFCWVPCMGGIKLQLLCGVRIELAVGSLPYPGMIRIPGSVLDETGNYLDSQFVSPVWTWGKIPLGIPTFLPLEGVHSKNQNQKNSSRVNSLIIQCK